MKIHQCKVDNPTMALWQVGNEVPGVLRTQKIKAGDDREDVLLKRRALAATVCRYLKRVQVTVDRVGT